MKKKLTIILIILGITTILISKYNNIDSAYTMAYNLVSSTKTSITTSLLEDYYRDDSIEKKDAERIIKEVCLNNLNYDNWKDYIDYININIYKAKVIPGDKEQLIISLNLSKDIAVIAFFEKSDDSYRYIGKLDNLLPIEDIKFINIPKKNHNFLVTYQINDERLGAYFYEKKLSIYMNKEDGFDKVLDETLLYEEIFKSNWVDKNAGTDEWIKNIIENDIRFQNNDNLSIFVSGLKNKYISKNDTGIPSADSFKLVSSNSYDKIYYWNEEFEKFSLCKETMSFNGTEIIIIGDTKNDIHNITGYSKDKYKVLTTSGRILYIDKKLISED